ncbi:hypothetical protein K2X30_14925 [bacterium]|nr:hypothetical protein [bacterium]
MGDNNNRFKLGEDEENGNGAEGSNENEGGIDYTSQDFEGDRSRLVDFLKFPRDKRKVTDFLQETYKAYEEESVNRLINRAVHEHESEMRGATPYYKPGHIGPLMYEYLNMIGVEAAFVSGLQHTKSSMTKTVQQRVDEINTLLRGVGGFNRQIKASFSRSAVVYLEQEDPANKHREKVIFTINLGDFELRYPLDESADEKMGDDGRTLRRTVWDEAVNTLAEIVSNTGMKPKYVKNDKNSCIFTMRQYLLSPAERLPDEFFTFDLRHVNEDMRKQMARDYVATIEQFGTDIAKCKKQLRWPLMGARKRGELTDKIAHLERERDFYIGTNPDPREMDTGVVFSISVNTLKDYAVTKDKMQVIMTKYILALSRIAVDKSMDQQVSAVYQQKQGKAQDFQSLDAMADHDADHGQGGENGGKKVVVMKDDLVRKKAAGGGRFRA